MISKNYKNKYLKYKNKYLLLKNQIGGIINIESTRNITNAGMINFDDDEINDLKGNNLLDSFIFFRNNRFFREIRNLKNDLSDNTNSYLNTFFTYLNNNFEINDNSGGIFVNRTTNKFENRLFKLDNTHRYQTTIKDDGTTQLLDGSGILIDCENFIWEYPYSENIRYIDISKGNDNIYQARDSSNQLRGISDGNLGNVLNSIYIRYKKSDSVFSYRKCSEFTTSGNFGTFNNPIIFKDSMKNSVDDSDIFQISSPNIFIVKSKNLLFINGLILIIQNIRYNIDNTAIEYIKIKPYISFINVNEPYDEALKELFRVIRDSLNRFFGDNSIQVLPLGFYHIHIIKIKNENKLLLILHNYVEDFSPDIETIPDRKEYNYNGNIITKIKNNVAMRNREYLRKHNNLVLIDLDDFNMYLFSVNPDTVQNLNLSNQMFNFSMGRNYGFLKYNILGNSFAHLSWFENRDNPMNIVLSPIEAIEFGA